MFVNSRRIGYHPWTTGLMLLTVLALSSCGNNQPVDTASNNSASTPTVEASESPSPTTSPSQSQSSSTTSASQSQSSSTSSPSETQSPKAKKQGDKPQRKASATAQQTLSPEAEKLGVQPEGRNCPSNAPIKGKTNQKGRQVFHTPGTPRYQRLKPEICFADAATAQKAGFRASKASKQAQAQDDE